MASITDVVVAQQRWLFPYGLELIIKERDTGETVVSIEAPPYARKNNQTASRQSEAPWQSTDDASGPVRW